MQISVDRRARQGGVLDLKPRLRPARPSGQPGRGADQPVKFRRAGDELLALGLGAQLPEVCALGDGGGPAAGQGSGPALAQPHPVNHRLAIEGKAAEQGLAALSVHMNV